MRVSFQFAICMSVRIWASLHIRYFFSTCLHQHRITSCWCEQHGKGERAPASGKSPCLNSWQYTCCSKYVQLQVLRQRAARIHWKPNGCIMGSRRHEPSCDPSHRSLAWHPGHHFHQISYTYVMKKCLLAALTGWSGFLDRACFCNNGSSEQVVVP